MNGSVWIDVDDCLSFHQTMLERFGGLAGLRDEGLLESAQNRPRQMFACGQPSLFEMAAAYAGGIVRRSRTGRQARVQTKVRPLSKAEEVGGVP